MDLCHKAYLQLPFQCLPCPLSAAVYLGPSTPVNRRGECFITLRVVHLQARNKHEVTSQDPIDVAFNPRHLPPGSPCLTSHCTCWGAAGPLVPRSMHMCLPHHFSRSLRVLVGCLDLSQLGCHFLSFSALQLTMWRLNVRARWAQREPGKGMLSSSEDGSPSVLSSTEEGGHCQSVSPGHWTPSS